MEKRVLFGILGMFIFLCAIYPVSAQELTGGQYSKQGALYMDAGVIVNNLMYDTIQVNHPITLYMTPYEQSGKTVDNSTAACRFGVVSPDGSRLYLLYQENFTVISEEDIWTATIPASFFNETGRYLYNWDCQESIRGGYFNGNFMVTPTGEYLTTSHAILYGFVFLIIVLFIFMSISGVRKAEDASWLIFYICLTYILLYIFVGAGYLITSNFLWEITIISSILYMAWLIMGFGLLPFVFGISLYILGKEAQAALEEDFIRQGYSREEAKELSKKKKR